MYTPDDTVEEGEIETGKRYIETDFNKIIEIKEREKKRVELFMEQINQTEKTLVFCATQDHALAVRDLTNQMKTSNDPNYCQRVTANDGTLGEQHLRDFQDNEKLIPTILTTSQKLSTGVDARNIRNIILMRPINSMIEFKQIIGRGTRLYDGKDYFTIYDFVKAHHHFNDPEWDGEPAEPEETVRANKFVDRNELPTPPVSEREASEYRKRQKIKIKLADGKERSIQHMMATTFWHPDGTPMSAQQFMEILFGKLPELFKNEDELRRLWSTSDTRAKLLQGLAERGFGSEQMAELQRMIDAEKSDLFDVLAHIAYALPRLTAAYARAKSCQGQGGNQHPLHQRTAAFPRLRAVSLRECWCGGTRSREAHAVAPAQIPRLHCRCRGRPRQAGRDRQSLRGVPKVSVSTRDGSMTLSSPQSMLVVRLVVCFVASKRRDYARRSRDCTGHRVCHCDCEDCGSSRLESAILYGPG
jgi:hypothetical protein